MKRKRLTQVQMQEAITRYQSLDRMENIAKDFGCTRQAIFKILKKAGIDTSKKQRIERTCPVCGITVFRRRGMARKTKNSYCSDACYREHLHSLGEAYNPSNYHSRMAREIIRQYFDYRPEEGHIVHHINKDCQDNRKKNLEVYACQRDHLRHHRGFQVTPLWSGVEH